MGGRATESEQSPGDFRTKSTRRRISDVRLQLIQYSVWVFFQSFLLVVHSIVLHISQDCLHLPISSHSLMLKTTQVCISKVT